ncbi:protein containing D-galactarate dehydratase/Altronate hydrolase, partial [human gut metagenome]
MAIVDAHIAAVVGINAIAVDHFQVIQNADAIDQHILAAHHMHGPERAAGQGVLQYGDTVKTPGLNLLSAPGNDLVAATALAAAGAHIVLFTTGRGTPFASPVPTMKIATNSR